MTLFTDGAQPGTPYWWEGHDWPDLSDPTPETCDVLVIGAGYTGLSAAIAAADAGAKVVVVDSGQPGQGASTRNGGMFGAHPKLSHAAIVKAYGAEAADRIYAEAEPARHFAEELMSREGIDCDFQRTGRVQCAWTREDHERQADIARESVAKGKVNCRTLTREELSAEITTPLYEGGLLFEDHAALNPLKWHHGLLQAARGRGVQVCAYRPVFRMERVRAGFEVVLIGGRIKTPKVIVATNGYTGRMFERLKARVFPLPSYLIATEPLSPNMLSDLAPGGRMMVETRATYSYFRASPDGTRLIFGGRAAMVQIGEAKAARRLRETLAQIWPAMADVRLSHAWKGNTGYSFSHLPHVGEDRGMVHAMGYSGSGTVLAPYLGAKAGWLAVGDARSETGYNLTPLKTSWMYRGGPPHFLRGADIWYRGVVDRRDRKAAARL